MTSTRPKYKPFLNEVDLLEVDPEDVPPLVRAWRHALLDFHDIEIVPRYKPADPQYTPLAKLLQLHNGKERYGPLYNYQFCQYVVDKCVTHGEEECSARPSCAWCPTTSLCVAVGLKTALGKDYCDGKLVKSSVESYNAKHPANPLRIVSLWKDERFYHDVNASDTSVCKHYIKGEPIPVRIDDNAKAMYYHWFRDFMLHRWDSVPGRDHEENVVIIYDDPLTARNGLFEHLGLFSRDECYRYSSELPDNTCFLSSAQPKVTASGYSNYAEWAVQRLGLDEVEPPTETHVGIISRSFKRFLLNEQELLHATLKMNVSAELLLFDELPLYRQVLSLRRATVLVGMHGSGMVNALFLRPGSVLLQLMPYRTGGGATFFMSFAEMANAVYQEWTNDCPKCSIMHWDILNEEEKANWEQILEEGGWVPSGNLYFYFWINQETYVPPDEFQMLISKAIKAQLAV